MSTAGPSQGATAPLGGSRFHAENRGGEIDAIGLPMAELPVHQGGQTGVAAKRAGKVIRRPVHGVLLLDKPLGWSSNDALQKVKWLMRAEKAGHTGTLDPLATGVLPLCFGAATKFSQLQLEADKTYQAVAKLGVKTTTADAEGEVIERREVQVTQADVDRVAKRFTGQISQMPPMHSALKKDGKPLYAYARAGIEIEREARNVTIYALDMNLAMASVGVDPVDALETVHLTVKCSKGTYIRTLGEDVGEALGCGAHLVGLRRVETGGFDISQCVTLEALEAMTDNERLSCLKPVQSLLAEHTVVELGAVDAARFLSGVRRRGDWPDASAVAVYGPATSLNLDNEAMPKKVALLGTAHVNTGELIPGRLLSPLEIEQILESEL